MRQRPIKQRRLRTPRWAKQVWKWAGHVNLITWMYSFASGLSFGPLLGTIAKLPLSVFTATGIVALLITATILDRRRKAKEEGRTERVLKNDSHGRVTEWKEVHRGQDVKVTPSAITAKTTIPEPTVLIPEHKLSYLLRDELRKGLELERRITDFASLGYTLIHLRGQVPATESEVDTWEERISDLLTPHPLKQARFLLDIPQNPFELSTVSVLRNPLRTRMTYRLEVLEEIVQELSSSNR